MKIFKFLISIFGLSKFSYDVQKKRITYLSFFPLMMIFGGINCVFIYYAFPLWVFWVGVGVLFVEMESFIVYLITRRYQLYFFSMCFVATMITLCLHFSNQGGISTGAFLAIIPSGIILGLRGDANNFNIVFTGLVFVISIIVSFVLELIFVNEEKMINEINKRGKWWIICVNYLTMFFPLVNFVSELISSYIREKRNIKKLIKIATSVSELDFKSDNVVSLLQKEYDMCTEFEKVFKVIVENVRTFSYFLPLILKKKENNGNETNSGGNDHSIGSIQSLKRNIGVGLTFRSDVTVGCIYMSMFECSNVEFSLEKYEKFIDTVSQILSSNDGYLISFDQSFLVFSFNCTTTVVEHERSSLKFVCSLLESIEGMDIKVNIVLHTSSYYFGNVGGKKLKNYQLISNKKDDGIKFLHRLCSLAATLNEKILICESTNNKTKLYFQTELAYIMNYMSNKSFKVFKLLNEKIDIKEKLEWKYQISENLSSDDDYVDAVNLLMQGDFDKVKEMKEKHHKESKLNIQPEFARLIDITEQCQNNEDVWKVFPWFKVIRM